jgi:putative transcriptional regulator
MNPSDTGSLKGHFLMAMPGLVDPNFIKTVTCIADLTPEGALGFVVNRVHPKLTAKLIFEELDIPYAPEVGNIPIHIGGPVHVGEVFILHGPPFDWEGCLRITPQVALSNTMEILKAISRREGPESFLIMLGCAGWGPGQLETELQQNAWLTTPVSKELMFALPVESRWEEAVRQLGISPEQLTQTAGHA